MRLTMAVAMAVALSGCGGPPANYTPNFAGSWIGTLTETDVQSGQVFNTVETQLNIEPTGTNLLELVNFSALNVGPTVTVTSATQFSGSTPFSCRPSSGGDCTSVVATYTAESATLNGATLNLQGSVTFSGCGDTELVTFTFDATR